MHGIGRSCFIWVVLFCVLLLAVHRRCSSMGSKSGEKNELVRLKLYCDPRGRGVLLLLVWKNGGI